MNNEIVKEFVVKRNSWRRGKDGGNMLRTPSKTHCCLGFLGKACGFKNDRLLFTSTFSALVDDKLSGENEDIYYKTPKFTTELENLMIAVNDEVIGLNSVLDLSPYYKKPVRIKTEADRERILKYLFNKAGIKVIFED